MFFGSNKTNKKLDCFGSVEPHNDENITNTCHCALVAQSGICHDFEKTAQLAPTSILPHKGGCGSQTCFQQKRNFSEKVYSRFTSHFSQKSAAFTLAEVLITLGIIGVVAAMTMPSLMQNYKRQQATARIKKFVSVINQALISAENDLGPREDWVIEGDASTEGNSDYAYNFLNTYIKPYIKSDDIEKRRLFGMNMATLRFVDGSQMSVKVGACYDIFYDINGEKGPNEKGRDIFVFILCKNGGCNSNSNQVRGMYCQPNGEPFPTHEQLIDNCKDRNRGSYCTILLEQNGYEFPKDYPLGL